VNYQFLNGPFETDAAEKRRRNAAEYVTHMGAEKKDSERSAHINVLSLIRLTVKDT
jgi:hypothetical protein